MKQKFLTTILILFACANLAYCAQGGNLQGKIQLQDSSDVVNKINNGSLDSPYMDMMNNPMMNSMMNSMNAFQSGANGNFQQMEQVKQQAEYAKQQANYMQQMEKEDGD